MIYMVFTPEGVFEVAIESWLELDVNPRELISIQMLYPTDLSIHEVKSYSDLTPVSSFILAIAFISRHVSFYLKFAWGNRMSVAE